MDWSLPFKFFRHLIFIRLTVIPSALWAGAISPISIQTEKHGNAVVPAYKNTSLIREYPSEFGSFSPVRTANGIFAYNVGLTFEGDLLSSAATGTIVDGNPRQHWKLDNTGFTYSGRSYGVGSSVGRMNDDTLTLNSDVAISYTYQEIGYRAEVNCIHNDTSEFILAPYDDIKWAAVGFMPNSNGNREESMYIGRGTSSIVAIGVTFVLVNGTQYLAIASGANYASLNMTQCSINYIPTIFDVSIGLQSRNITVTPAMWDVIELHSSFLRWLGLSAQMKPWSYSWVRHRAIEIWVPSI